MLFTSPKGFTLVELLLSMSIAAFILIALSLLALSLVETRVKHQTIAEVETSGRQTLDLLLQTLRNAAAVNSPAVGNSSATLSINIDDNSKNPTVIDLSNSVLRMTEGSGSPISLTSASIIVESVAFKNLSRAGTRGIISVELTFSHTNPNNRNAYEFTKTFYGSASLR
ncbi:MAG: Uncharacterized protein G01um101418_908 [Parcubacteria group bacterium Gr01-1014_18]|nr:MAG: Uncharacterized protein Greene041636_887 [Parcubacteria group bacterium Greene0416_36]TSC79744.1 MAG: Uncharacterized protein G01um101418_908 [Parcubacteria group bacterium Gr01-1014_18]TSC97920.1 MAG: Uncharacterized protein Greene101420_955 [Parcubacteria group bacterium Greene1014_20]TSD06578.1 MAG: Uncharacterized protein Greene07142_787 [Parcubacteria group bacterium Greene0714_2]